MLEERFENHHLSMFKDDNQYCPIGRKILSSSMVGSPRWYNAKFQDQILLKLVLVSMKNEIGNLICHHYSTFHVNNKFGLTYSWKM